MGEGSTKRAVATHTLGILFFAQVTLLPDVDKPNKHL
jgi:hypothetical protein